MKVSTKQSSKIECLKFLEPFIKKEWFKKLVCFVKRMRKNKIVRWVTNIAFIFIVMRIGLYYSYISAHTILEFPFWVWGIIPATAIFVLLFVVGAKGKEVPFAIFFGCCVGIFITGLLIMLVQSTNYWFANSESYHREAYVMGKKHITNNGYRHWFSKFNVSLIFLDNKEYFRLDDSDIYKTCDQGDTVNVTLCKGLYGIPIVKDLKTEVVPAD